MTNHAPLALGDHGSTEWEEELPSHQYGLLHLDQWKFAIGKEMAITKMGRATCSRLENFVHFKCNFSLLVLLQNGKQFDTIQNFSKIDNEGLEPSVVAKLVFRFRLLFDHVVNHESSKQNGRQMDPIDRAMVDLCLFHGQVHAINHNQTITGSMRIPMLSGQVQKVAQLS